MKQTVVMDGDQVLMVIGTTGRELFSYPEIDDEVADETPLLQKSDWLR